MTCPRCDTRIVKEYRITDGGALCYRCGWVKWYAPRKVRLNDFKADEQAVERQTSSYKASNKTER